MFEMVMLEVVELKVTVASALYVGVPNFYPLYPYRLNDEPLCHEPKLLYEVSELLIRKVIELTAAPEV
jgi:hypothetical protein